MGDVSHVVPSIHPMIGIEANGAVNHQREFAAHCVGPAGDKTLVEGAKAMALTAVAYAADPDLVHR